MTLQEAADAGMTGCAMIVWGTDSAGRRNTLYHAEVQSGNKTVCGRLTNMGWRYMTCTFQHLARRVAECDNLCSECSRLLAEYDFSSGKEPSRL